MLQTVYYLNYLQHSILLIFLSIKCIPCVFIGLPRWLGGKESPDSVGAAGDLGSVSGLGRSHGGGNGNPLQYSCLASHMDRQRSLAGYSPRGRRESDMTERLSAHLRTCFYKAKLPWFVLFFFYCFFCSPY